MGALFTCLMDEDGLDKHARDRLIILQKGTRFNRKTFVALGVSLGSEPVEVRLSEDQATISWRTVDGPSFGSVKVTSVEGVRPTGATGLVLAGKGQSKELELEAGDAATRDTWVIALSEVVERSKETGKHGEAEKERRARDDAAKKQTYWSTRRGELADLEKAAAERKKKFAGAGMKFTAQAMAGKK